MSTSTPGAIAIDSRFVTFPNSAGLAVVGVVDAAVPVHTAPWVVIAPKYGETKKNNLPLAYLLAANGFVVLRFDFSNHIGESAGDMPSFTLAEAVEDVRSAVAYASRQSEYPRVALVANSLSARMALRVTATDPRVGLFISVVGIVNVADTLTRVYQEDVVAEHLRGRKWGINDVLGFPIHFENFLSSLVESGLHTLAGAESDARQSQVESVFIAAERDAWVELKDVRSVAAKCNSASVIVLEGALHDVRENASASNRLQSLLLHTCLRWANMDPRSATTDLPRGILSRQNKHERDRLRQALPQDNNEEGFWANYLVRYGFFGQVEVYQQYLADVGRALGRMHPRESLLDAGCGNGLFGVWVLRDLATSLPAEPALYVGLDLTRDGLSDAWTRHAEASRPGLPGSLSRLYSQVDLDELAAGRSALAFADGTFDKICCSLVLSYLASPGQVVRELARILRPGGRIVVTSMRPFADLSELYLLFAAAHRSVVEIDSARALLNAAGRIKAREEQGYYTFFSGEELCSLLADAGLQTEPPIATFGDQAVLVAATKA